MSKPDYHRIAAFIFAVLIASTPARAQQFTVQEYEGGNVAVQSDQFESLDDALGPHAPGMNDVLGVALERHPDDRFKWWKKPLPGGFTDNSCAAAASNLYDEVHTQGALPDGWQIRQVGTLGSLTTFENAIAEDFGSIFGWWGSGEFSDPEFDALNPPSYAHSLTIVETDDGAYFTVDTWGDEVEVKRVYPMDDEGKYFSEDPNATNLFDSHYKVSELDERGRPFKGPNEGPPAEDPPKELKSEPPPTSETADVEVLTSADPNDKTGLLGAGNDRFITPDERMRYLIRFENMPDASAPAQEVLIVDTLDTAVFDLSTFRLGEFTFGSTRVPVPPGLSSFNTRVPIYGSFEVVISASLVPETGIVTWRFTTIDTDTGDLPFDPLDGFLPPNQAPPEGEGSVAFSVSLKEGLASGTVIRNQARIIFDLNEPIDTPPWVNTLDIAPPTSAVAGIGTVQSDGAFSVSWSGSDGEAGVSSWDVFASVDGGSFYQWLRRLPSSVTEETFVGQPGSTYAFYSVATDAVGNRENPKTAAEAEVTVGESSVSIGVPSGWALVGLPSAVADPAYRSVFPSAIENTFFAFSGGYEQRDVMERGEGYWLRFPGATGVSLVGTPFQAVTLELAEGWNLVSGPACTVPLSSAEDPESIVIAGTLFGFSGAYVQSGQFEAGQGYWLRASQAGQADLSCAPGKGGSRALAHVATEVPEGAGVLVVTDDRGAAQRLFFGGEVAEEMRLAYSMPPVPPRGAFDARFSGDTRLMDGSSSELLWQSAENQVEIVVEQPASIGSYVLEVSTGDKPPVLHKLEMKSRIEVLTGQRLRVLDAAASTSAEAGEVPARFALEQNYPNPFNPQTTIRYALPEAQDVRLVVYDMLGREVAVLVQGRVGAGQYEVVFDAQGLSSGTYFYQIDAGPYKQTRRFLLMK